MKSLHDFEVTTMSGELTTLKNYQGKVLLVVNTASKCGLTPQFAGLEQLYQRYREQGFEILGFPCNQFAGQDPGSNADIQEFCQLNYGVSFPMHQKIEVNGPGTHPLYQHLKAAAPGILGSQKIKWNFTKFLVGRDGKVIKRFAPATSPAKIAAAIEAALQS